LLRSGILSLRQVIRLYPRSPVNNFASDPGSRSTGIPLYSADGGDPRGERSWRRRSRSTTASAGSIATRSEPDISPYDRPFGFLACLAPSGSIRTVGSVGKARGQSARRRLVRHREGPAALPSGMGIHFIVAVRPRRSLIGFLDL
jgi:hypothetical protein